MLDDVAAIDWSAPWLAPYRETGKRIAAALALGENGVASALNAEIADARHRSSGVEPPKLAVGPLRFVAQGKLPAGQAYERFIAETGCVPTRDNLHDLFNGLAWLRWPTLKRHLNELQAAELGRQRPGATSRGAVRDALTLFDENAALLRLPAVLDQALRRRDWQTLFVTRRQDWADAEICLFGHALIEKLVKPRKPITAHVWLLPQSAEVGQFEASLCDSLTPERLAEHVHLPLPVLGVPGWWPANEEPGFYADSAVFRPLRENSAAAIITR